MKILHAVVMGAALFVIQACSHPIEIRGKGEGDVSSASHTRNCSLEAYQAGEKSCSENLVVNEYNETYTAEARVDAQFHRWGVYCLDATTNTCSFNFSADTVHKSWGKTVPPLQAIFRPTTNTGFNSLLMGHSFFYPFSLGIAGRAVAAGFTDHVTHRFTAGGGDGAPMAFWNSTQSGNIKAVLDTGDIDLFGMTWYPTYPDITGYTNWADYALAKNPDTRFFLGLPWTYNPQEVTTAEYEANYHAQLPVVFHALIDELRAKYPGVDFYCIPYGQAAVELRKLFDAGELAESGITTLVGPAATSVFTDSLGHPGKILEKLGELIWLRAIYAVDLTTNSEPTGYSYDLKALAQAITDQHDVAYNAPPETYPDSDGIAPADRYDDDDDNDGVLDADDICPQDPDPDCTPIADSVTVAGTDWAQPDLFLNLSWNAINAICPASKGGVCGAGTLNGHYVTGWVWASVEDLNGLVNAFIAGHPMGPGPDDGYYEPASAWATAFVSAIRPTLSVPGNYSRVYALSRDTESDSVSSALLLNLLSSDDPGTDDSAITMASQAKSDINPYAGAIFKRTH